MRQVPEEMAERIESGAATLCHAWRVTRADGVVMGFTDHDLDVVVDGVVCRAGSGWTAGAGEAGVGLAAGAFAASGGLDAISLEGGGITEADVAAGVYDGAGVELWRVDWRRPDLRVRLWAGTMALVKREGEAFVAELEGPLAKLERVVGRTYGRDCDAILGDGRCGVELEGAPAAVCDKRWGTCVGTFGNGLNFQGFPEIPGDDFLAAYPVTGGRHDGTTRR